LSLCGQVNHPGI